MNMNTENTFEKLDYERSMHLEDRTISVSKIYEENGCEFIYFDCVNTETQIRIKLDLDDLSSLTAQFDIKSASAEKTAEITSYINENMNTSDDGIAHFDEFSEVIRSLISVLKEVNL